MKKLLVIFSLCILQSSVTYAQHWDSLGSAIVGNGNIPGNVFTITQYDGNLFAGGFFSTAGGLFTSDIAQWDGVKWDTLSGYLGYNMPRNVTSALCVYNNTLVATGGIPMNESISQWHGLVWHTINPIQFSTFFGAAVFYSLTVYQGNLYVSGQISSDFASKTNIAVWNGATWDSTHRFNKKEW